MKTVKTISVMIALMAIIVLGSSCNNYRSVVKADKNSVYISGYQDFLFFAIPKMYKCAISGETLSCRTANVNVGVPSIN
jgi:hypothetical protein